jgi:hypothetical protein
MARRIKANVNIDPSFKEFLEYLSQSGKGPISRILENVSKEKYKEEFAEYLKNKDIEPKDKTARPMICLTFDPEFKGFIDSLKITTGIPLSRVLENATMEAYKDEYEAYLKENKDRDQ